MTRRQEITFKATKTLRKKNAPISEAAVLVMRGRCEILKPTLLLFLTHTERERL